MYLFKKLPMVGDDAIGPTVKETHKKTPNILNNWDSNSFLVPTCFFIQKRWKTGEKRLRGMLGRPMQRTLVNSFSGVGLESNLVSFYVPRLLNTPEPVSWAFITV